MQLLILCGGKGERLKPLTDDKPKPLLEVLGKPIIEYQIDFFKRHGFKDIVLCTGYKHKLFEEMFPDFEKCVEKDKLGTAGAIKNAEKFIKDDFLMTNGDNIFSFNFQKMNKMFLDVNNPLLALTQLVSPYGVIDMEGDRISQFREKPVLKLWINAGITMFKYDNLDIFPKVGMIEYDVYPKLVNDRKLFGFKMRGDCFWLAIDSVKDLKAAEKILLNRK